MTGVAAFRDLLATLFGWSFDDKDAGQLAQVLSKRAEAHEMTRDAYLARLGARSWSSETTVLAEMLTVTETYFFRHGEQFRALRELVLPERVNARKTQRVLRLLSVPCSSGEEAYSLAISAREAVEGLGDWILSVVGVDANPAMLRRAADGKYSAWSLRETPEDLRKRWFDAVDNGYRIREEARALVQVRPHNVAEDDPRLWLPDQFDVIFCRNLLMYLTPEVAGTLVRRMTRALAPGGYLFLGHTDSLGSRPDGLEARHSHHTFYYRRPDAFTALTVGLPAQPAPASAPGPLDNVPDPVTEADAYQRAVGLLQAERFADALELITARLPGRPQPRDALLHGVLLVQTGKLEEATVVARRLSEGAGLYADAHQLLGLCHEGQHEVDEAIAQYQLAAYLDPRFAQPRLRLGQLARRRGDDRTAAAHLEQALTLLATEDDERITLFGGGFGRIALTVLCRSELDACGVRR